MGFYKLLIVGLAVYLGFVLFKKIRNAKALSDSQSDSNKKMIACSVCQTHVPEDEAIMQNGKIYCSKNCL